MQTLYHNIRLLCDDWKMLTGLTVVYGTASLSESLSYGRAQEVRQDDDAFMPCERPLTDSSLYDLASLTKFIVCVAAMQLVESGKLRLDEYVGDIDKRFKHLTDVTVHDVLCYRANLQTPGRIDSAASREEGLSRLFAVSAAPLSGVRIYSDINAMVVKYVIEAKTGLPLYEALDKFIFSPIGMRETFAVVPQDKKNRCLCYNYEHRIVHDRYLLRTDVPVGSPHDPKALFLSQDGRDLCGHAGLFSTRQDMTRFAQALLRGGLLTQDTLLSIGQNRTGTWNVDGTYRQPLGFLCFAKHPNQHLSEVPAFTSDAAFALSGFTGNHLVIDPKLGIFELFLGNRCHARVSHITPPDGKSLFDYGLDDIGSGLVTWPDGRLVPSSAKYVYQKDACLHEPIAKRMQELGWLTAK